MIRDENTGRFLEGSTMVGALISNRIKLLTGEYPRDLTAGADWSEIIGSRNATTAGAIIQALILQTNGVRQITAFSAELIDRVLVIEADILTEFGTITLTETIG